MKKLKLTFNASALSRVLKTPLYIVALLFLLSFSVKAQTPVAANGQLRVSGTQLVNEDGEAVQLRGMSTHGLQWYSSCINYESLNTMVSDWGIDILRLAMYTQEDGYITDPEYYKSLVDELVDLTEQYGIYCLIDWHVHDPGDPWEDIEASKDFWEHMSAKHADKEHVIYEICNEPNGVNWDRVKTYAEEIIPIIRANDPNQVIIVGTPNWSQDVDIASQDPLAYDNLMYTLHFYSGTHTQSLRDKAETAMENGAALFVTEWGTSQASGDGGPYIPESETWMSWMQSNKISWCNWSYADKDEISAALEPGSCFAGDWNSTTESGTFVKNNLLSPADAWAGSENIPPVASVTSPDNGAKYEIEPITFSATASDQDGTVTLVEFYANGSKVGEDDSKPYSIEWTPSAVGTFGLTLQVTDNDGAKNNSSAVSVEILDEINQSAYPDGIPHPIPGTIQSTNYDVGGEGIAYHDDDATNKGGESRTEEGVDTEGSEGGNVGYVVNGEWLEYTVNVSSSDVYSLNVRCASQPGGGKFYIEMNGTPVTGSIDVASTGGWASYQDVKVEGVELSAGEQVMRMVIEVGDFNFSKFVFEGGSASIPVTGVTISQTNATIVTGATLDLNETVAPSTATNKSVSWTTSNASVATVSSSGLVSAVGEGSATITVTTADGNKTATCALTVTASSIPVTGVTISQTSATIESGATLDLNETVAPSTASNKSVSWTTSNASVATVSSSGLVSAVGVGSAIITVTTADGNKTATCNLTVTEGSSEGITIESVDDEQSPNVAENLFDGNTEDDSRWSANGFPKSVVIDYGEIKSITGTRLWTYQDRSYHYTVEISNSPSSGFTTVVDQSGATSAQPIEHSFAATSGRYVKITVTAATGYSSSWVSLTEFEIVEGGSTIIPVTGVNLDQSSVSIELGQTSSLTATVLPADATNKSVSYSSSNTSVATVNSSGVISAVSVGSATITVTTADGSKTDNCAVTVTSGGGGTGCNYEPMASALPTLNTDFSNIYVSDNGPDLSNIRKFNINWDLTNNGLYVFAFNTDNGVPNWYVPMKAAVTHTLGSSQPEVSVSGSGITGFDGDYYVIMDGENLVLAEKSGAYIIYFSNSDVAPDCDTFKSAEGFESTELSSISLYPNPVSQSNLNISGLSEKSVQLTITDMLGKTVLIESVNSDVNAIDVSMLKAGTYIVIVKGENEQISKLFNKL